MQASSYDVRAHYTQCKLLVLRTLVNGDAGSDIHCTYMLASHHSMHILASRYMYLLCTIVTTES